MDIKEILEEQNKKENAASNNQVKVFAVLLVLAVIAVFVMLTFDSTPHEKQEKKPYTTRDYCRMCDNMTTVTRYRVWYMSDIKYESFNDNTKMNPEYDSGLFLLCDDCKDKFEYYNGCPIVKIEPVY